MGRKLMRVPLDFDWPINETWKGYLNPYSSIDCKSCDRSGYNPETRKLYDTWYSFGKKDWAWVDDAQTRRYNKLAWNNNLNEDDIQALINADRLWDFTRVPITDEQREIVRKKIEAGGNSWLPENNGYVPTPDEVNEWNKTGIGHCGLNAHVCIKAKAKRLGVYGKCPTCEGKGYYFLDEKFEKLHEEWGPVEPPKGAGYQLWETTSEGSPVSPVFEKIKELCEWCTDNATTFGSFTASADEWRSMLDKDFVCHQQGNMIFV